MISRLAIVNRGEPAVRLVRAVREWNRERDRDVRVIALATAAERRAMFVRQADETVLIAPRPGGAANPYLDLDVLRDALVDARADAVWVGWGFVAERPEFAELCEELGITFIGPSAEVMRRLGDKIGSKLLAEEAGVPMAPWSGGPVATVEEAIEHGRRIGYPLVVKATAGGGGRGIRFVDREDELAAAIESAQGEAARAFGDGTVFMEGLVGDARHVEVQIVADDAGQVWALGVRDCSVQRRRQKVLEESSSVALDEAAERELRESAVRLAPRAGYRNAGTVEFLYQPETGRAAFLEVNTRLQVEHPVTEETTGVDIVKLQLHVAEGGRLDGPAPAAVGHAIEARLNAEDPDRGFAPAPGTITHLTLPSGPGIRVDSGVAAGDVIPPEYDSMIAKVIAVGRDRERGAGPPRSGARRDGRRDRGRQHEQGVPARPAGPARGARGRRLDRLARPPDGRAGRAPRARRASRWWRRRSRCRVARRRCDEAAFFAMAARGRPQTPRGRRPPGRVPRRRHRVPRRRRPDRPDPVPGRRSTASGSSPSSSRSGRTCTALSIGDRAHRVLTVVDGADILVEVDDVAHRVSRDEGGLVRSPAPGLVVAVPVQPGQDVDAGATVAVIEAMKMETAVTTPVAGRVTEVLVGANVQVAAGAPLVRVDAADADAAGDARRDRSTSRRW